TAPPRRDPCSHPVPSKSQRLRLTEGTGSSSSMAKSLRPQVAPKLNGHKPAPAKPARNGKAGHGDDPFLGEDFADDQFEEFGPVAEELAEEEEAADEH